MGVLDTTRVTNEPPPAGATAQELDQSAFADWELAREHDIYGLDGPLDFASTDTLDRWISRYHDNQYFHLETGRWRSTSGDSRVPTGATARQAFDHVSENTSFGPYWEMLKREVLPVVGGDANTLRAAAGADGNLNLARRGGESSASVAYELKHHFDDRVLEALHADDLITGAGLNPNTVTWDSLPPDVRSAIYDRMNQITTGINSADRGRLTELWQQHFLSPGSVRHVRVQIPDSDQVRVIDFIDPNTGIINEVKAISGSMDSRSIAQFDNFMTLVQRRTEIALPNGTGVVASGLRHTFQTPAGARNAENWRFMARKLRQYDQEPLSFQLFDDAGRVYELSGTLDLKIYPDFDRWLGAHQ